jgi:hypothetical protein
MTGMNMEKTRLTASKVNWCKSLLAASLLANQLEMSPPNLGELDCIPGFVGQYIF